MQLGRESAYGVFVLLHLATYDDRTTLSREDLADACGIPADTLTAILDKLIEAKIIARTAEASERFALTRRPNEITLLAVAEAIEGPNQPELVLLADQSSSEMITTGIMTIGAGDQSGARQPSASAGKRNVSLLRAMQAVSSIAAALLRRRTIADLAGRGVDPLPGRRDDSSPR